MTNNCDPLQRPAALSDLPDHPDTSAPSATSLTEAAFARFKASRALRPPNPAAIKNDDELDPMALDEMEAWVDGNETRSRAKLDILEDEWRDKEHLWVIRTSDVVHSAKKCAFGSCRMRGEITHTNLTGGKEAFAGGEMMLIDENTVVINGDSGRYGTKDDAETEEVARAFAASGWETYWVGMDEGIGRPGPIVGSPLRRVT